MAAKEEKMARMFQERITSWKESQVGQTNGYEYERSFASWVNKNM